MIPQDPFFDGHADLRDNDECTIAEALNRTRADSASALAWSFRLSEALVR